MSITLEERKQELHKDLVASPIGVFSVLDNYASVYRGISGKQPTELQLDALRKNWGKVNYTGNISKNTARVLRVMLTGWSRSIEVYNRLHKLNGFRAARKIVFLTLTIPKKQMHSDDYMKRSLLGSFIQDLKRQSKVNHYFWKAESQKNGNIHFHILVDNYVHKSLVNWLWDKVLSNHGYFDKIEDYSINYGSTTTKIEAPKSNDSIAIYVVKYCLKDNEYRLITGRLWGCSDSLREIEKLSISLNDELFQVLQVATKKNRIDSILSNFCDVYVGNVYAVLMSESEYFQYESDVFYYDTYHMLYNDFEQ